LQAVDGALARWPEEIRFIAEKARILQGLGQLEEAGALLKPLRTRPESFVYRRIVAQAILQRRYGDAIGVLEALLAQEPDDLASGNLRLELGHLRALSGDALGAAKDLEEARTLLAAEFLRQPKNGSVLNALALTYCYLGDRKKALTYVQKALGLATTAGSRYEDTQVRILAYFGDRDGAIQALERLQKMPSGYYTPAMLRLDPIFDKLRSDPRFEALTGEVAKSTSGESAEIN
jgi:tetratricopeptide (TPR) repeat protein